MHSCRELFMWWLRECNSGTSNRGNRDGEQWKTLGKEKACRNRMQEEGGKENPNTFIHLSWKWIWLLLIVFFSKWNISLLAVMNVSLLANLKQEPVSLKTISSFPCLEYNNFFFLSFFCFLLVLPFPALHCLGKIYASPRKGLKVMFPPFHWEWRCKKIMSYQNKHWVKIRFYQGLGLTKITCYQEENLAKITRYQYQE